MRIVEVLIAVNYLMEVPELHDTDDMAQLGAGSALPSGPPISSLGLEGRPEGSLNLLAEAAGLLSSNRDLQLVSQSTPQGSGTALLLPASKAHSEPPLGHHIPQVIRTQFADRTTTDQHPASSLLLLRAAGTSPSRPTLPNYPPGAETPISSL